MRAVCWAARLAQSVEHQTFNLRVKGSSPLSGYAHFFSNRIFVCLLWFGGRLINIAPSYWSVLVYNIYFEIDNPPGWFYGVMVSTQDSESCDPSSNLGRTWVFIFLVAKTISTRKGKRSLPRRGIEPRPPRWERGILTTRLPGNSTLTQLQSHVFAGAINRKAFIWKTKMSANV